MPREALPDRRPQGSFEIGKDGSGLLVVGFDGTDPSRNALAYAAGLARRENATLLIAFVESLSGATLWFFAGSPLMPDLAPDFAEDLRAELGHVGVPWRFVSVRGDTARELESLAAATQADAIVVGRSRSTWRILTGNVPRALVKHARRTILIVP